MATIYQDADKAKAIAAGFTGATGAAGMQQAAGNLMPKVAANQSEAIKRRLKQQTAAMPTVGDTND